MPQAEAEKVRPGFFDFYDYPPVGEDDWRYMFQSARVRSLETLMLTHGILADMANAEDFASAMASLGGTEYTLPQGGAGVDLEVALQEQRAEVRELFQSLMLDERIVAVFKSQDDFANLRLILRRALTDKPVGTDYSSEGNVSPEVLVHAFEEENYSALPEYMRQAADEAALAYYQNKDIRAIDHAIDRLQADYKLGIARQVGSIFLSNLFRVQIDLTNIRTMLRLKFLDADERDVFLAGGFIELERFRQGLDLGYEALGALFFGTPYHSIVDAGAGYVAANGSFLKVEQQCDDYLMGYLRSTAQITAGPQPIIAYLLTKEQEVRTVRLILTAKRNHLDKQFILDRMA